MVIKPLTLLSIAQLGNLLGVKADGENLSAIVRRSLCAAALKAGYLIVPNVVPGYVTASGGDVVTIIRQELGETLSPSYPAAHLMIELGMSVAMGNGQCEPSEIRQLSYVLERNFSFSELDVRALTGLKDFLIMYPPDMDGVAATLLKMFTPDECRDVARMIATVGAAGSIGSGKIIALRKLYAALNMDERGLYQLMMSFRYSESGIIEVRPVFDPNAARLEPMLGPAFKLDLEVVATKKRETESVGMILSEIFSDED
jgi:hypothetical protein